MSAEQNKSIVRRWVESAWNHGDFGMLNEAYLPNYVLHDPQSPAPVSGPQALREYITAYRTAFPDLHMTVEDIVAEGDRVAWRFRSTGTQTGTLANIPPTGKTAVVSGTLISRFENGKWAEDYLAFDLLGLLQQLGVVPAPQTASA
jgi:steroid delta-isomerase-like uncharacterized protein